MTYPALPVFKRLKQPTKLPGLSKHSLTGLKFRHNHTRQVEKNMLKEMEIRHNSPPLSKPHPPQNSEVQPFPLPVLPRPDIPVGGRLAHFVEQWEEWTDNKWVLSIVRNGFKIPFKSVPPLSVVLINLSQSSLLLREKIGELLKKQAVERVRNLGTPRFYSRLFFSAKKNGKLPPVIVFFSTKSVYNQTAFQDGDSQVSKTIHNGQRLGISSCSDTSEIQKIPLVHL